MDMDEVAIENGLDKIEDKIKHNAIKSISSIFNKFERNIVKDLEHENELLRDVLRTTIIIKTPSQLKDIIASLEKRGYEVWDNDIDNLFEKDYAYKHIAIKLKKGKGDPLIKELILIQKNMQLAKEQYAHGLYDIDKEISLAFPKVERFPDIHERLNEIKEIINRVMNKFYKRAYLLDNLGSADTSNEWRNLSIPSPTKAKNSRDKSASSIKLPKREIRSLIVSLKAIWQPILAKLSTSSTGNLISEEMREAISLVTSSIVTPSIEYFEKFLKSLLQNIRFRKTIDKNILLDKELIKLKII